MLQLSVDVDVDVSDEEVEDVLDVLELDEVVVELSLVDAVVGGGGGESGSYVVYLK